ncbi:MAG TPA: hypothetical protein VN750_07860 [Steroidobacteraceae bacterium]|nr:hypothetical protein [Steroidobacteraceae bacterium]
MKNSSRYLRMALCLIALVLSGCGGGSGGGASSGGGQNGGPSSGDGSSGGSAGTPTHTLGGTITGLSGASGLTLANGNDSLEVAVGASTFTMPMRVPEGNAYLVIVQSNPPGLSCNVSQGSGTMATGNVTNIAVVCSAGTYSLGGTIGGLSASGLVLANGADTLSVEANSSSFTMPTGVAPGDSYDVTVKSQPVDLTCTVSGATGTMATRAVTDILVACSPSGRSLGGPSSGDLPSSGAVSVTLTCDPGFCDTGSQTFSYSPQNSTIRVSAGSNWFAITIDGTQPWPWSGWMQAPTGQTHFQPGNYPQMWQLIDPASWGSFNWSGENGGFDSGTTSVTINSVTYVGDVMTGIDFNFDHTTITAVGGLHGHVSWNPAGSAVSIVPLDPPPSDLWQPAAGAITATGNYLYLESDTADYVGQGGTYTETPLNSLITVTTTANGAQIEAQGVDQWVGQIQAMANQTQLQDGYYQRVERFQTGNPARGGFSWSGDLRGCNRSISWFVVDDVSYTNGVISALDMRFEQHCELAHDALRGQIHWRASDTTVARGPTAPPPGLWQPAPGATPASGNYVYLYSDAGDYVVAGPAGPTTEYLYTSPADNISVSTTGPAVGPNLTVNVGPPGTWTGQFAGMYSLTQFEPGYYGPLVTTYDPAIGMLNWSGMGRGCDYITGWLVIDSVSYASGALTSFDLRFEQHCQGATPALHGKIHWSSQ